MIIDFFFKSGHYNNRMGCVFSLLTLSEVLTGIMTTPRGIQEVGMPVGGRLPFPSGIHVLGAQRLSVGLPQIEHSVKNRKTVIVMLTVAAWDYRLEWLLFHHKSFHTGHDAGNPRKCHWMKGTLVTAPPLPLSQRGTHTLGP